MAGEAAQESLRVICLHIHSTERLDEDLVLPAELRRGEEDVLREYGREAPSPQFPQTADHGACPVLAFVAVDEERPIVLIENFLENAPHEIVVDFLERPLVSVDTEGD